MAYCNELFKCTYTVKYRNNNLTSYASPNSITLFPAQINTL